MGIREDLLKLAVEIGPRGACSAAESKASRFIQERFEERGLETSTQEFRCINTYSYPYIIYLVIAVICACFCYLFPLIMGPIALVNVVLFALDLETFPLLSRLLPRRKSRNVIGELPSEDGRVGLVVTAHYDSARSALSFHPELVKGFRTSFSLMIGAVFTSAALSVANFLIRLIGGKPNLWVWVAAMVAAAYLLVPVGLLIHREFWMDYTPGANDNASGVVTMLALMDKISEPESRLGGVIFVATGAEEVGTVGMIEFLSRYRERIKDALIVNLDNLGSGHLCYIDCEGMLLPHRSSPVLLWLAGKVAEKKRFPIWRSGYRLLSTDATPALARGYSAMSLMAFDNDGMLPNWHWESDTVDNVDMGNIEVARGFLWNLAKKMDLP